MQRSRREQILLWSVIFGWIVAIPLGWVVEALTHGRVPMAIFPIAWIAILAATLIHFRRRADASDQANFSR